MRAKEKFEATKQAELTSIFTNDQQDAWKSFQGRMLRRNGYRNVKVRNVRESLGAGVLWTSYVLVKKKNESL